MDISEKLMRLLFDFQRFEQNERLDKVIHSTESCENGLLLEDDRLDLNAAREPNTWRTHTWEDDKH